MRLFPKAVLAFLVLPGIVAYAAPVVLLWWVDAGGPNAAGVVVIAVGSALLLWCVRDFYVAGKGTLAPWAPPQGLVTVGMYRVSRNPMYVAVLIVTSGWAVAYHSVFMVAYTLVLAIAFHVRVVRGEEPWLADAFGEAWARYRARVPRWLGLPRRVDS